MCQDMCPVTPLEIEIKEFVLPLIFIFTFIDLLQHGRPHELLNATTRSSQSHKSDLQAHLLFRSEVTDVVVDIARKNID